MASFKPSAPFNPLDTFNPLASPVDGDGRPDDAVGGSSGDLLHLHSLQAQHARRCRDGPVAMALPTLAHAVGTPRIHLAT